MRSVVMNGLRPGAILGPRLRCFVCKASKGASPRRPSLDDVDKLSRGKKAKVRGTGSRAVPHRLNAEERSQMDIAKGKGFLVLRGSGYRRERKGSPLANTFRQWADVKALPTVLVQQGSGGDDLDAVLVDISTLRLENPEPVREACVLEAAKFGNMRTADEDSVAPFTFAGLSDAFLPAPPPGPHVLAASHGVHVGPPTVTRGPVLAASHEGHVGSPMDTHGHGEAKRNMDRHVEDSMESPIHRDETLLDGRSHGGPCDGVGANGGDETAARSREVAGSRAEEGEMPKGDERVFPSVLQAELDGVSGGKMAKGSAVESAGDSKREGAEGGEVEVDGDSKGRMAKGDAAELDGDAEREMQEGSSPALPTGSAVGTVSSPGGDVVQGGDIVLKQHRALMQRPIWEVPPDVVVFRAERSHAKKLAKALLSAASSGAAS